MEQKTRVFCQTDVHEFHLSIRSDDVLTFLKWHVERTSKICEDYVIIPTLFEMVTLNGRNGKLFTGACNWLTNILSKTERI